MGVAGALIGGMVLRSLGFSGFAGTSIATLGAVACAVLLTSLTALSNGRRIYSRQL
jgi:uncharacterized membrane protein YeaQ/YmgE (transglycosylase-associated protein family)